MTKSFELQPPMTYGEKETKPQNALSALQESFKPTNSLQPVYPSTVILKNDPKCLLYLEATCHREMSYVQASYGIPPHQATTESV